MTGLSFSEVWKMACEAAAQTGKVSWIRPASAPPGTSYGARTADPRLNPNAVGAPNAGTIETQQQ
jgi:hypothetical protein